MHPEDFRKSQMDLGDETCRKHDMGCWIGRIAAYNITQKDTHCIQDTVFTQYILEGENQTTTIETYPYLWSVARLSSAAMPFPKAWFPRHDQIGKSGLRNYRVRNRRLGN